MSDKLKFLARARAPNFSKEEQLLLCSVLEPFRNIIESKKTDSVKQVHKQEAWDKITEVFNANTKCVPRSTDNLISCYRNMKSKVKKQHSESKMNLQDTVQKEALLNAIEDNGQDWDTISIQLEQPMEICKNSFDSLQKEVKKKENDYKKKILGTGGGPPPADDADPVLSRVKKMIEPQIDGLYTMYDGDALLMKQYQESMHESKRTEPIEFSYVKDLGGDSCLGDAPSCSTISTTHDRISKPMIKPQPINNRTDLLRKKKASELNCDEVPGTSQPSKRPKNVSDSFLNLSEQKLVLVKLQRKCLEMDIEHKRKIQALELEDLINQNKHKENMRQKEMLLMDMKIKKFSE